MAKLPSETLRQLGVAAAKNAGELAAKHQLDDRWAGYLGELRAYITADQIVRQYELDCENELARLRHKVAQYEAELDTEPPQQAGER